MNELNSIEVLGYVASAIIAVSIMMKSVIKLRVINLIGAFLLGTYGIFIESTPIIMVNYFIAIINAYYLCMLLKPKKIMK